MIPKVIHYCWFGGKPLPRAARKCVASWESRCPDYTIRQWTEKELDISSHPFMKASYEAGAWAFVSDYARLKIVYEQGGIYLDTDVELLKSLNGLLDNPCFVGVQQVGGWAATGLGFGAEAGSPAVKAMLEQYDDLPFDLSRREEMACPILNTRALEPFGYRPFTQVEVMPELTVYPSRYLDPLSPGNAKNLLCGDTVSIHHYDASWQTPGKRLKRTLIRLVGEERIMKLKEVWKK